MGAESKSLVFFFFSVWESKVLLFLVTKCFDVTGAAVKGRLQWAELRLCSSVAVFAKFLPSAEPGRWKLVTEWRFVITPGSAAGALDASRQAPEGPNSCLPRPYIPCPSQRIGIALFLNHT